MEIRRYISLSKIKAILKKVIEISSNYISYIALGIGLVSILLSKFYPNSKFFNKPINEIESFLTPLLIIIILVDLMINIKKIVPKLEELRKRLDEFDKVTLDTLKKSVFTVNQLAGKTFISESVVESKKELVGKGFEALSSNLAEWGKYISISGDDLSTELWLSHFATYFREEAFDIRRKEIITNARNYPFLIAQTLITFIKNLKTKNGTEKVLFFASTPIHPKDWYNWPHGRDKPRAHYEEDFMRLYRGFLQEIAFKYKEKVDMKRVVFFVDNDKLRNDFSWPLSNINIVKEQLEKWYILDIPIKWIYFKEYLPKLFATIYSKQQEKGKIPDSAFVVPAFCQEEVENVDVLKKELKDKITQIKSILKNNLLSDKEKLVKAIPNNNEEKNKIENFHNNLIKGNSFSIIEFYEFMQELSVKFAEHHDKIHNYMLSFLRYLNSKDVKEVLNLLELWTNKFHTSKDNALYFVINNYNRSEWNISTSFAAFGYQNRDNINHWKLVVLSEIPYPFITAKIQFLNENDPVFLNYINFINSNFHEKFIE